MLDIIDQLSTYYRLTLCSVSAKIYVSNESDSNISEKTVHNEL